jgi:hypothetical protein
MRTPLTRDATCPRRPLVVGPRLRLRPPASQRDIERLGRGGNAPEIRHYERKREADIHTRYVREGCAP